MIRGAMVMRSLASALIIALLLAAPLIAHELLLGGRTDAEWRSPVGPSLASTRP